MECIYQINEQDKKIKILGEDFVKNNEEKCILVVENEEYKLMSYFEVKNLKNKK